MIGASAYRPEEWHDFFVTLGGAAAVLMGLVFVALSLNEVVVRDATHRYRAIGTLTNFAGIFVLCALSLMGDQSHVAIGIEWFLVSGAACSVYVYGYVKARSSGGSPTTLSVLRTVSGTMLYTVLIAGSVVVIVGAAAGPYIAGGAMLAITAYSVSGAWLLLVGAYGDKD